MATFDVNANSRKVQSTANGSTDEFSFSFQVNQTSDVKVFVDGTQKNWRGDVIFSMVQTISRDKNLDKLRSIDMLVIDESHHAAARTYKKVIRKVRSDNPNSEIVGFTATPNRDSFSCNLYEEKWNQHYPEVHLLHLAERHLTVYLNEQGLKLLSEKYFYEETSYADPENDLLTVAEALKQKNNGEEITVPSPAFYKNMLTLIYQSS